MSVEAGPIDCMIARLTGGVMIIELTEEATIGALTLGLMIVELTEGVCIVVLAEGLIESLTGRVILLFNGGVINRWAGKAVSFGVNMFSVICAILVVVAIIDLVAVPASYATDLRSDVLSGSSVDITPGISADIFAGVDASMKPATMTARDVIPIFTSFKEALPWGSGACCC